MKVTAVVPSLQPDEKFVGVVDGLIAIGFTDIVLVNDGSSEDHLAPFKEAAKRPGVTVLTHEVNKGKGRAMKTAFQWILDNRPESTGIVAVDGDGQHLPKDVLAVAKAMEKEPEKLWLGVRDFSLPQVPPRSKMGNKMTRALLRFTCGVNVTDTQTGLRAISRELLPLMISIEGERYEYETQQLLDAKRNNVPIGEVVIETVYIDENQTSHYNPFKDSMRILKIIFKYIASSISTTALDWIVFTLLNVLLAKVLPSDAVRILIATYGARIVSNIANYVINAKLVFKSNAPASQTAVRYFILSVVQAAISYGLVLLIETALSASLGAQTIIKMIVDMSLAIASYQFQMRWVFANKKRS